MSDRLLVDQNLLQCLCAQNIPQGRSSKQSRRILSIGHLVHRHDRIEDAIVDDGVDSDGHRVLGQNLLRWHVERDRPQVNCGDVVHTRQNEEETGALGAAVQVPAQAKNNGSLVLLHDLDAEERADGKCNCHQKVGEDDQR